MRFTETWTWTKGTVVKLRRMQYHASAGLYRRVEKDVRAVPWMREYRQRVHALNTDEKAAAAIRAYHEEVVRDWQAHLVAQRKGVSGSEAAAAESIGAGCD